MKTLKILAILGFAVIAAALVTASAYAYMGSRTLYGTNNAASGNYGYFGGMVGRGGMMQGGYGYASPQQTGSQANSYGYGGFGCGAGTNAGSNYNNPAGTYPTTAESIDIATAASAAQNYVASIGDSNLAVAEVEEYTNNFYVQVKEKNTGIGAFELLINKYTGAVAPEMGPNMMWNTKYGMYKAMMGYYLNTPTTPMTVDSAQAKAYAQQYLAANQPATTVGSATTFYGYYTIEVLNGSATYGMLSVNGYTGQVWYHTWHGSFIQEWTG